MTVVQQVVGSDEAGPLEDLRLAETSGLARALDILLDAVQTKLEWLNLEAETARGSQDLVEVSLRQEMEGATLFA